MEVVAITPSTVPVTVRSSDVVPWVSGKTFAAPTGDGCRAARLRGERGGDVRLMAGKGLSR